MYNTVTFYCVYNVFTRHPLQRTVILYVVNFTVLFLKDTENFEILDFVPGNIFLTSLNSKIVCQEDILYAQVGPVNLASLFVSKPCTNF
jgi:hypothetical protein